MSPVFAFFNVNIFISVSLICIFHFCMVWFSFSWQKCGIFFTNMSLHCPAADCIICCFVMCFQLVSVVTRLATVSGTLLYVSMPQSTRFEINTALNYYRYTIMCFAAKLVHFVVFGLLWKLLILTYIYIYIYIYIVHVHRLDLVAVARCNFLILCYHWC